VPHSRFAKTGAAREPAFIARLTFSCVMPNKVRADAIHEAQDQLMFRFSGRIDRTRFFIGVAIRIALFAASVVGFPFIQFALLNLSSCRSVSGACGAVALLI
jgi:hypothetical protein